MPISNRKIDLAMRRNKRATAHRMFNAIKKQIFLVFRSEIVED